MDLHLLGDQHIMKEEPLLSGSSTEFLGAQSLRVKEVTFNQKTLGSDSQENEKVEDFHMKAWEISSTSRTFFNVLIQTQPSKE